MVAQELRIGNLVKLNNKDFHAFEDFYPMSDEKNIWSVECIFRDGSITMYNALENLWKSCEVSDIENIELTEEWLVKFGFYYSDDENEFLELQLMHKTKLYANNSNKFSTVVLKIKENEIEIKSVHQLQNLYFALTQKELTL